MKRAVCVARVALCLLAGVARALAAGDTGDDGGLVERLSVIEVQHAALCAAAHGEAVHGDVALADEIGPLLSELRTLNLESKPPAARIEALNHLFYGRLGIWASQDLKDPCNLLPSSVLARRQGYCVGIAALYLVLAERLDLPIYAVATPSHVFLRYDDDRTRINIETLQGGANVSDEQYIREQKIPEECVRRGIFMRNLTTDEFLGQVHNNLGVICSERRDYERAAAEYREALDLDPRLPAAFYNRSNDQLRQGEYRGAIRRFSKSLRLYQTDVWALNNRGLAYMKLGKREKARRDLEGALRIDQGFEPARRNLRDLEKAAPCERLAPTMF
jgi:regulator of sirC expression with transglutaminase-like and TPR domain